MTIAERPLDTGSVVLVDEAGRVLGSAPKLDAHQPPGMLHSAFSLFVFDCDDRLLLHRRAQSKYHFGGLWTNSCCSHPAPGESLFDATHRRVDEELGMTIRSPQLSGRFQYVADDPASGLVEHELDHVVCARATSDPVVNPDEIDEIRWLSIPQVQRWLAADPSCFTPWFERALALAIVPGEID